MAITTPRLDADELLHLAIAASRQDQHEKAIGHLKQAIEIAPDNARVRYFLGAEHAQIGLYERAMEEMAEAVKLDPSLHTASFQLGLLQLTSGRVAEAGAAWQVLDALGTDHPLHLFKTGLLALANDDFAGCRAQVEKGIARNSFSEALNQDMRRVLERMDSVNKPGDSAPAGEKRPGQHVFLSAYTGSDSVN